MIVFLQPAGMFRIENMLILEPLHGRITECNDRTWIIHEPRLLQMRGVTHVAVVVHRKWVTTNQMQ